MISNLKFMLKLFQYSINRKTIIFSSLFFVALGLLYLLVMSPNGLICFCGMYFIGMAPLVLFQNLPTFCSSMLIASSEHTRHLTSKTMVTGQGIFTVLVYAVQIALGFLACSMGRFTEEELGLLLVTTGFLMGILMVYNVTAYKTFLLSTLIFVVGMVGVFALIVIGFDKHRLPAVAPIQGILIGYLFIVIFSFLAYGVSRLLYRRAWDRKAMDRRMRTNE